MTFINDDEVKKVLRILLEQAFAIFTTCDRLIDGEIDVAALADLSASYFEARIAECAEILVLWIVNQHVAIGQKQYFRLAAFPFGVPTAVP